MPIIMIMCLCLFVQGIQVAVFAISYNLDRCSHHSFCGRAGQLGKVSFCLQVDVQLYRMYDRSLLCGLFKPEASVGGQCPYTNKRTRLHCPAKLCRVSRSVWSISVDLARTASGF